VLGRADRRDVQVLRLVGEAPVALAGAAMHAMMARAGAQEGQAKLAHQTEILLPELAVPAFLQLVAPDAAMIDGGVGALGAGREHEAAGGLDRRGGRSALGRGDAPGAGGCVTDPRAELHPELQRARSPSAAPSSSASWRRR
jgi:hypothetical protein